jgi:hypothetical protein
MHVYTPLLLLLPLLCHHSTAGAASSAFHDLYAGDASGVVQATSQKLVTLCSTLREFPYVRFSGTSARAEAIARDFQVSTALIYLRTY